LVGGSRGDSQRPPTNRAAFSDEIGAEKRNKKEFQQYFFIVNFNLHSNFNLLLFGFKLIVLDLRKAAHTKVDCTSHVAGDQSNKSHFLLLECCLDWLQPPLHR